MPYLCRLCLCYTGVVVFPRQRLDAQRVSGCRAHSKRRQVAILLRLVAVEFSSSFRAVESRGAASEATGMTGVGKLGAIAPARPCGVIAGHEGRRQRPEHRYNTIDAQRDSRREETVRHR
jgi:hypothetical protein